MNKYIKKTHFSYLTRGLYKRKLKTRFTTQDIMDLYIPNFKESQITIITYKNN